VAGDPIYDALIVGGGPAGSTAGRLLAQWGHSVVILAAPPGKRALAECLPPSHRKLFQFLGIQDAIDAAGFFRTTGNTVWWGARRRVEPYPEGWGYQVHRGEFDCLLLDLARVAGAEVRVGKAVSVPGSVRAQFILDCSGRAGVLARGLRVKQKGSRTVGLCGVWRNGQGWKLPDPSHTLVEAYREGWAWSVPLSPTVRHVAFMVDAHQTGGIGAAYQAELAKTRALRRIFSKDRLEGTAWGRDASQYSARRFYGPNFLLVGDAGSFLDPLSSFGVRKAMASAWMAAVVANTWLLRPAMRGAALGFFDDRERQIYAEYLRRSAAWFRQASGRFAHPFWLDRAELAPDQPSWDAAGALEEIRREPAIRLRRADDVRLEPRPAIEGREVVLRAALVTPGLPAGLDYLQSVDLPRLVEIAPLHTRVPDLFEAYNRTCPPVALPQFLTALATLVARKILIQ